MYWTGVMEKGAPATHLVSLTLKTRSGEGSCTTIGLKVIYCDVTGAGIGDESVVGNGLDMEALFWDAAVNFSILYVFLISVSS